MIITVIEPAIVKFGYCNINELIDNKFEITA